MIVAAIIRNIVVHFSFVHRDTQFTLYTIWTHNSVIMIPLPKISGLCELKNGLNNLVFPSEEPIKRNDGFFREAKLSESLGRGCRGLVSHSGFAWDSANLLLFFSLSFH